MKKTAIILVILIVGIFAIYQKVFIPKHTFNIVKVSSGDMDVHVNGVGYVGAKNIYKIGSIYGGKVLDLKVYEGDFVKKGDLLANVDSVDLVNKIDELKATISKIKNDINSLKVDKESAIVLANYQKEILKKNKKLFLKKAISELDFQKFKTNAKTSELKVKSLESKINSLFYQQKQIEANLDGLNEKLLRYTIISPIDGYVVKRLISNHEIVMPNQTLVEIVDKDDVWIETYIDTRISADIKKGDKATIKLRSNDKLYDGIVANIKPINNNVTNEREVDVSFKNLPIPFYLKEQAIVDISVKKLTKIVKVSNKAVSFYDGKKGVWIVSNNKINFKPIKTLAQDDKFCATKDLNGNETLAIPNSKKKSFNDGMKIYIKN